MGATMKVAEATPMLTTGRWSRWSILLALIELAASVPVYRAIAFQFHTAFSTQRLLDFASFLVSGRNAAAGVNPYPAHAVLLAGGVVQSALPNLNPPILLPLFELLGRLSVAQARIGWTVLSLCLYAVCIGIVWRTSRQPPSWRHLVWALVLAGLWSTLELGQIYIPFVLLACGACLALKGHHPAVGGALIGLVVAVKPQFAIWLFLFAISGAPTVAAIGIGVAVVLSLFAFGLYGQHVYLGWISLQRAGAEVTLPTNASIMAVGARLGAPWLGWILALALFSFVTVFVWHIRPPVMELTAIAIPAAILISPIAWAGYTLFLLPTLLPYRWGRTTGAGALLLVVPGLYVWPSQDLPPLLFALVGSFYCWALLLILTSQLRESWAQYRALGCETS